jgi:hypothetical protein
MQQQVKEEKCSYEKLGWIIVPMGLLVLVFGSLQ